LATGLSTAITKDGQTATTARIPFAAGISSTLVTDSSSTSTGSIITAGGVGVAKALYVGTTANIAGVLSTTSPNITTSITTPSTSFDLINATATTLNLGGAATAVNVGAATGTMTVANTTLAAKAITASTTLSVTGVTTVQAGTAALPAITTTGDTNTGIFFPAADTIAFTEGGVESMRIDSSANVTITGTLATSSRGIATASLPAGTVLQVVNATFATQINTSSATYSDTGLTASITPTSATSKIMCFVNMVGTGKDSGNGWVSFKLLRGATAIILFEYQAGYTASSAANGSGACSTCFLDSPATTSATTYKVQYSNPPAAGNAYAQLGSSTSTITLMEIAA